MKWRAHSQIFLWSAERRSQNECLPLGKIRNWYLILGKTSVFLQLKRGNLSQECIGVKEVRTNRSTYNKSINFLSLISISYNFPFIIYWSQRTGDLNTLIINGDLSSRQIRGDWGVSRERPEDPASASRSSSGPGDGREFSFGGKGITVTTAAIYSQAARGALTILKRFQSTFFRSERQARKSVFFPAFDCDFCFLRQSASPGWSAAGMYRELSKEIFQSSHTGISIAWGGTSISKLQPSPLIGHSI